jgi:hypothetical protein
MVTLEYVVKRVQRLFLDGIILGLGLALLAWLAWFMMRGLFGC